ncbi:MAG: hypothetical protein GF308_15110 [Candidatus Heimdallarchaeota archaeon]|nr:hypothetical protein [Candidatus Heimdallarchaeota archaeon]
MGGTKIPSQKSFLLRKFFFHKVIYLMKSARGLARMTKNSQQNLKTDSSIPPLKELSKDLSSKNPFKRTKAAYQLCLVNDISEAKTSLINALSNDPEAGVRMYAAIALAKNIDEKVLQLLVERLKHDEDVDVQTAAAYSISEVQPNEVKEDLIELLFQDRVLDIKRNIVRTLIAFPEQEEIGPTLLSAMVEIKDPLVRNRIIPYLLRWDEPTIIAKLKPVLFEADEDENLRRSVAYVIKELGGENEIKDLIKVIKEDPDHETRSLAAETLGKIGDKKAIPPLITTLETDFEVSPRRAAAWALGEMEAKQAIPGLLDRAFDEEDEYLEVRITAIEALAKIGDEKVGKRLLDLYQQTKVETLRAYLVFYLWRFINSTSKKEYEEKMLALLFSAIREGGLFTQLFAFLCLDKIPGALTEAQLFDFYSSIQNKWIRSLLVLILSSLKTPKARTQLEKIASQTSTEPAEFEVVEDDPLDSEGFWSEKETQQMIEPLFNLLIQEDDEVVSYLKKIITTQEAELKEIDEPFVPVLIEDTLNILEKIIPSDNNLIQNLFLFPRLAKKAFTKLFSEQRLVRRALKQFQEE